MKTFLMFIILGAATLHAQNEGLWEGYDGEWSHVSRQFIALAEATPPDKFGWRPAPGVRSMSEVYMEKTVTTKADVIRWLKRSLEAVQAARAQLKPGDLQRKVKISGKIVTVDGMYLRIIIHDNEHMGQLVAYARMNGIVPPWSKASPS